MNFEPVTCTLHAALLYGPFASPFKREIPWIDGCMMIALCLLLVLVCSTLGTRPMGELTICVLRLTYSAADDKCNVPLSIFSLSNSWY